MLKMITLAMQHIPGELRAGGPFSSPSSPEYSKGSHWSNASPTDVTLSNSHDSVVAGADARLDERESSPTTELLLDEELSDEDGLLITPAKDETDECSPTSLEAAFASSLTTDKIKEGGRKTDITSVLALYKSCSHRDKPRLKFFGRENSDDSSVSFLSEIERELSQFRRFESTF